jgi:hypothetical protein
MQKIASIYIIVKDRQITNKAASCLTHCNIVIPNTQIIRNNELDENATISTRRQTA